MLLRVVWLCSARPRRAGLSASGQQMGDSKEPSFAGPSNLKCVVKAVFAAVACLSALQRALGARSRPPYGRQMGDSGGLGLQAQPFESHPAGRAGALLSPPKQKRPRWGLVCFGGEGGIRTHGTVTRTPDFESGTFDHSATSPCHGRLRSFRVRPHYRRWVRESQARFDPPVSAK